jgi:predicted RNA polymerase sigma factor
MPMSNLAVAVAMADGPQAGLARVDALANEPALKNYHLLPSVRGDLLKKLGRLKAPEDCLSSSILWSIP